MKSPSNAFVSTMTGSSLMKSSALRCKASRRSERFVGNGSSFGFSCGFDVDFGFGFGVGFSTASRLTFARGFGSGFGCVGCTDTAGTVGAVTPSSMFVARWQRYDSFVRDVSPVLRVNAIRDVFRVIFHEPCGFVREVHPESDRFINNVKGVLVHGRLQHAERGKGAEVMDVTQIDEGLEV